MNSFDGWDPGQYNRFADERELPFWDLARLIEPTDSPAVADLGCGDGRLSAQLAGVLGAATMRGFDSSPSMIDAADQHATDRIGFTLADIAAWAPTESYDVVFANASMHWVPDHAATMARWTGALGHRGQLAVQVPANADHPAHRLVSTMAAQWLDIPPPDAVAVNVLAPERYAEILYELGYVEQHVRLQVYAHQLASTSDVVEWIKGTTLTRLKASLGPGRFEQFVADYRRRLVDELGDHSPYFYAFKRILMWGRRP